MNQKVCFLEFNLNKFLFAVYSDGRVCISILHAPGDDPMGYESSAERWSPVQSVEKILLSVVSMLAGGSLDRSCRHHTGPRSQCLMGFAPSCRWY